MYLTIELDDNHFTCRVAAIILIHNQLLLAKHRDYPCYYTVGGKVQINESTEEAILREMREETGIEFEIDHLAFVQERFFSAHEQEQHEITFYYKIKENSETKYLTGKSTDQGENEKLYLLDIDDLEYLDIVPAFFKEIRFGDISGLHLIVTRE